MQRGQVLHYLGRHQAIQQAQIQEMRMMLNLSLTTKCEFLLCALVHVYFNAKVKMVKLRTVCKWPVC